MYLFFVVSHYCLKMAHIIVNKAAHIEWGNCCTFSESSMPWVQRRQSFRKCLATIRVMVKRSNHQTWEWNTGIIICNIYIYVYVWYIICMYVYYIYISIILYIISKYMIQKATLWYMDVLTGYPQHLLWPWHGIWRIPKIFLGRISGRWWGPSLESMWRSINDSQLARMMLTSDKDSETIEVLNGFKTFWHLELE